VANRLQDIAGRPPYLLIMPERMKCGRVDVAPLCKMIISWTVLMASTDLPKLLEPIKGLVNSRAMPPIQLMIRYVSLANIFVAQCRNLKPSFSDLYDAILLYHKDRPCLGIDVYRTARLVANAIRKVLEWFRMAAFFADKRALAFRLATDAEIEQVLVVCDRAVREDGLETSVRSSTGASSSSIANGASPTGAIVSYQTPLPNGLDELDTLLDHIAAVAKPTQSPPSPPPVSHAMFATVAQTPVKDALLTKPLLRRSGAQVFDEVLAFMLAHDDARPLPAKIGAIQRGVTKSVKKNGGKQAFTAARQKIIVEPSGSKGTDAYARKKAKCMAKKRAHKAAIKEGKSMKVANALSKKAYAEA
jgi:hypothetical protein